MPQPIGSAQSSEWGIGQLWRSLQSFSMILSGSYSSKGKYKRCWPQGLAVCLALELRQSWTPASERFREAEHTLPDLRLFLVTKKELKSHAVE